MIGSSSTARLVAAQRRADARQQLLGAERLGDVVVRAGVERLDLLRLVDARRQHQDRHATPVAQPTTHLDAVQARQRQVEQDDVRPLGSARLERDRPAAERTR